MPRIYRVVGTDRYGDGVTVGQPNESSARRSVEDENRYAIARGSKPTWRAEYADIEWRALDPDNAAPTALERVLRLAEKWETATELDTGRPSIVTRAFAAEVRKALAPEAKQ